MAWFLEKFTTNSQGFQRILPWELCDNNPRFWINDCYSSLREANGDEAIQNPGSPRRF
jgi:hypothetical protein